MKSAITKIVAANVNSQKVDLHRSRQNKNNGIWQWNYYEHVIRNEKALNKIRQYIENNPLAEKFNWKELEKL